MAVVGSRQNKLPPATSSYVVGRGRGTGGPYTSKRGSNWLMFGTEEEEEKQAENVRIDLRRSIATMTNGGLFQAYTFHLYVSYHHVVVLI